MRFSTSLLADRPECITAVADMRWREWRLPPEPAEYWRRARLPATSVRVAQSCEAVGAV